MTGKRLVVGISGASGSLYGLRLLEILRELEVESHLVVTRAAEMTLRHESGVTLAEIKARADHFYPVSDIGAAIASGSFATAGMIVAPCSIHSLSEIATGVTGNLLTRAADVTLKERRRLVLMVRETPFHLGHLRTMVQASEIGAIIAPPVPAFYSRPETIADLIDHTIGRLLDLFEIESGKVKRWPEGFRP